MSDAAEVGNTDRFSGFADLYDANRPSPPRALGPLLVSYANVPRPAVVDLGSGTGLSSRWAAGWAGSVIGIEPNDDMRATAESRHTSGVTYRPASRTAPVSTTASPTSCWRCRRCTGWSPSRRWPRSPGSCVPAACSRSPMPTGRRCPASRGRSRRGRRCTAGSACSKRVPRRVRRATQLRRPIADDDPALVDEDLRDPHRNRAMPGGVRSWSKRQHLDRLDASGHFAFTRELVFDEPAAAGDGLAEAVRERFVALMRSQGSYQGLLRLGLTDDELGATDFEREVRTSDTRTPAHSPGLSFSWRVRLGVTPAPA